MCDEGLVRISFFSSVVSASDMSSSYLFFLYIEEVEVMPECFLMSLSDVDLLFLPLIFVKRGSISYSSSIYWLLY